LQYVVIKNQIDSRYSGTAHREVTIHIRAEAIKIERSIGFVGTAVVKDYNQSIQRRVSNPAIK
jgi:hypothetical protein